MDRRESMYKRVPCRAARHEHVDSFFDVEMPKLVLAITVGGEGPILRISCLLSQKLLNKMLTFKSKKQRYISRLIK